MKVETFEMERMQSTYENAVEYNLSESGVHPMQVNELLEGEEGALERMLQTGLGYPQSNGTTQLRERIAALYPGATADHIFVTNGTSEANFVNTWCLVEPDDDVVFMLPNYMQIYGIARAFGGRIRPFHLREENNWAPDIDELRRAVTPKTRLIAVCNPNNPTGAVLSESEMKAIVDVAAQNGCWLLADEVYLGAERNRERTSSFWGRYPKVIVNNGVSKAYAIPGLRIGWVVGPQDHIAKLWSYHDYLTIGPSMLSDQLAQIALRPDKREKIFARTRAILNKNFPLLSDWVKSNGDLFTMIDPPAGAIAYMKYRMPINSTELVNRLRVEKSVLIVPGDHFGMDHYLRIGYGTPSEYLLGGLNRAKELLHQTVTA